MQVTGCRVASSKASVGTLKRCTEKISKVRSLIIGGDRTTQLAAEIQSLSRAECQELLQEAQLPVVIPTHQALSMEADLEIPWNKLWILRRYTSYSILNEIISLIIIP